jgi:dTDP-L-rhamnose 4-epimerase
LRDESNLKIGLWDFYDEGAKLSWEWTPETHSSPPNQYAISKYAQEIMSINFGKRYNIPTVAMRYSIVQGERQSFYNMYSGALRIFSMHYNMNEIPIIYEDGEMMRDFINIHDVVEANLIVLKNPKADYETFNVGGGKPISIKEFCMEVAKAYNHNPNKLNIPGLYRFGDTRNACSNIDKLKKLGWHPQNDISFSIKSYKEYLQNADIDKDYLKSANEKMKKLNVVRATN